MANDNEINLDELSSLNQEVEQTPEVKETPEETKAEVKPAKVETKPKEVETKPETVEVEDEVKTNRQVPVSQLQKQRRLKQNAIKEADYWKDIALKAQQSNVNIKENALLAGEDIKDSIVEITDEDIKEASEEGDTAKAKTLILQKRQQDEIKAKEETPVDSSQEIFDEAIVESGLSDYFANKDANGQDIVDENGEAEPSPIFKKVVELDKSEPVNQDESLTDRYTRILDSVLDGAVAPEDTIGVGVKSPAQNLNVWQKIQNDGNVELNDSESQEVYQSLYNQS